MIVFSQHYTYIYCLFNRLRRFMKSECGARHFMTYDDKNTFSISSSQTVNRATKCPLKLVVFSIFKKISKVLHAYNWLKLQSLLSFAKAAFLTTILLHTQYCLSHILKKRSEKIKILMTAFMSIQVHPETRDGRLTKFFMV